MRTRPERAEKEVLNWAKLFLISGRTWPMYGKATASQFYLEGHRRSCRAIIGLHAADSIQECANAKAASTTVAISPSRRTRTRLSGVIDGAYAFPHSP